MELTTVLLLSLTLIISSTMIVLLNIKIRNNIIEKNKDFDRLANEEAGPVTSGYAYTIDIGDSMVVVVVVEKKNASMSFLNVQSSPLTYKVIERIE